MHQNQTIDGLNTHQSQFVLQILQQLDEPIAQNAIKGIGVLAQAVEQINRFREYNNRQVIRMSQLESFRGE